MHNSITNYKEKKSQTTKFIDKFECTLAQLMDHIQDFSEISLKMYELIVQQSLHLQNESFFIVLLIRMYFIRQALQQVNSEIEIKCREELIQVTQKLQSFFISNKEINPSSQKLFLALLHQNNYQQAQTIFSQFFIEHSLLVYSQFKIIWKIVNFNNFLQQQRSKFAEGRMQVDAFRDQFKDFLSQRQAYALKKQTCLYQLKMFASKAEFVSIVRQKVPMSKLKQDTAMLSDQQMPRYRYNITIKEMMLAQINLETIGLVEGSQAYKCPYVIFLIPFAYLLAECLTYYSNHKQLYIYHIFAKLCQRINKIKNGPNPQLPIPEIDNTIIDCINFTKCKDSQLRDKLGKFISKHQLKMSIFMPFYYQIFSFHAFQKYSLIQKIMSLKISMQQRRKKIKEHIEQIYERCNKYNDSTL